MNRIERNNKAMKKERRRKKLAKVKDFIYIGLFVTWITMIIISVILYKSNIITEETTRIIAWIVLALIAICSLKW